MSDVLGRLAQRVVAPQTMLQPRLPSLFEAAAPPVIEPSPAAPPPPPRVIPSVARDPEGRAAPERAERLEVPEVPEVPETPVAPAAPPTPAQVPRYARDDKAGAEAAPEPRVVTIVRELVERIPAEIAAAVPAPAAPEPAPPVIVTRRVAPMRVQSTNIVNVPAPPERDVHITIGRIDVRAVTAPPARERQAPKSPRTLSLDEYLAQRSRR